MQRLIALWMASLVLVAIVTSALMQAQPKEVSRIISGNDIGFKVEGTNSAGDAVGTWVVRIDGRWVAATSQVSVHRP